MTNEITAYEETSIVTPSNPSFVNTLDVTTVEGQKQTINAINNAASLNGMEETPLHVIGVITMAGVRKGRGAGQVDVECQNTYLVTPDGAYYTQSDGIARSVNSMLAYFGPAFFAGGVDLKVTSKQLANGNTLKSLMML